MTVKNHEHDDQFLLYCGLSFFKKIQTVIPISLNETSNRFSVYFVFLNFIITNNMIACTHVTMDTVVQHHAELPSNKQTSVIPIIIYKFWDKYEECHILSIPDEN